MASFTCKLHFLDGTDLSDSSVGERGSRNTVFLTDAMEGLEQMATMITRHCRTQSSLSVVVSNLKPTIKVLCPACQIKEFVLGKHSRIRAVLKMESGLVVLKCQEFNPFPISPRNMFSSIRSSALGTKAELKCFKFELNQGCSHSSGTNKPKEVFNFCGQYLKILLTSNLYAAVKKLCYFPVMTHICQLYCLLSLLLKDSMCRCEAASYIHLTRDT